MERGRHGVALIKGLPDRAPGLAQLGIVEGDADQPLRAILQSALQDGPEQLLGLPLAARVQKILRAPTALLAAIGPNDAGQATAPQADKRTEGLPECALKGALLGKHGAPAGGNGKELGKEAHCTTGLTENVFFSKRRKRSPRATFLESDETRLSRSTAMPN